MHRVLTHIQEAVENGVTLELSYMLWELLIALHKT